jgi:septal ring factor EnvC (AmiA/AmiB activator)
MMPFFTQSNLTFRRNPMRTMNRIVAGACATILLSGSLLISGCSSSPDDAQLKQLNDLKEEVASLQKQLSAKEQEKSALEKTLADQNAKIKKVQDDQAVVKQRLGK